MERITLNVHSTNYIDCKYQIIRDVGLNFNWKITEDENIQDSDIIWHDCSISADRLSQLKVYQKINHFPGMSGIFRKNCMANNLNRFRKLFPHDYNFYPRTWVLPTDLNYFKSYLAKKKTTCIVKPEASSQGQGIYLVKKPSELQNISHCIAQTYLPNPLLIDSLKFDLRIYVLVTGCDPLRIFIHEEGLARFATEEYKAPNKSNMKDVYVHLTNYSINKTNPNFVQAQSGKKAHKRSLSSILIVRLIQEMSENAVDVELIWDNISDIIVKTIITIQPSLASCYKSCQPYDYSNSMCFEILGFDIILDEHYKPWLLEVNHSPSFSTDSHLDSQIKTAVITDALNLLNINTSKKKEVLASNKKMIRQRSISKSFIKTSKHEKILKIAQEKNKRDVYEDENCGGYIKIYPGPNDEYYQRFLRIANDKFNKLTTPKGFKVNSYSLKPQEEEDCLKKIESINNISACLSKRREAWA